MSSMPIPASSVLGQVRGPCAGLSEPPKAHCGPCTRPCTEAGLGLRESIGSPRHLCTSLAFSTGRLVQNPAFMDPMPKALSKEVRERSRSPLQRKLRPRSPDPLRHQHAIGWSPSRRGGTRIN